MIKKFGLITLSAILLTSCGANEPSNTQAKPDVKVDASSANTGARGANEKHLLDGISIDWTYTSSGSGMLLSFENGLAEYEWISGSRKGRSAKDIPYQSRKIGDDMYLLNWVQPEKPDFITLIFDFKNNTAYSSGLIGYGTERQRNLFLDGIINSVER